MLGHYLQGILMPDIVVGSMAEDSAQLLGKGGLVCFGPAETVDDLQSSVDKDIDSSNGLLGHS